MSRLALVTGAAGGIGLATVERLGASGWAVAGIDVADPPQHVEFEAYERLDLGDAFAGEALSRLVGTLPRLDALVNNAGLQVVSRLAEMSLEDWERTMAVNLRAAFLTTRAAHRALQSSRGAVVNVSSVHAVHTSSGLVAYAASKGGLVAFSRALALEWAADGIRVNAVLPGAVDTPMLRAGLGRWAAADDDEALATLGRRTPLGRVGRPTEIAEAIVFLADGERSSFITGQSIVVDGGVSAALASELPR